MGELLTETSYVLQRQRLPKKQLGQITQYTHLEKKITYITKMKTFVAIAVAACVIPAALSTFDLSGISFPVLFGGSSSSTAASGLAITGLSSGTAAIAGLGGVVAAIGAGAILGGLARAATRRGKRSVIDDEQVGEQFIFDALSKMDELDCGKRYVCELAATPIQLLSQSEVTSLLLFQTQVDQPESAQTSFNEAIRLGALTRNPLACERRYATCPTKTQE